ncbi:hypothetical protein NBH00_14820 [Paraconexibacter antarcticus]|uniref:Type II toxin-antitoxin system RelE/ParE family toxin n=1 Tax=Paraconexibacter antarcticus TaxID=2949664 RepID=A0ABY5DLC4_9ACTN|nr:hypothetical protein [Paraconexibacter antarcticus]UTI62630.1 hypothetical protein NBH00_14820 [Paraconexibacter antarcticus]
MWSINQTAEFKKNALQLDASHKRFVDCFSGILTILARDPYEFSIPAFQDQESRVLRSRRFMDGFTVFVGFEVDDDTETVLLTWIERVPNAAHDPFEDEPDLPDADPW